MRSIMLYQEDTVSKEPSTTSGFYTLSPSSSAWIVEHWGRGWGSIRIPFKAECSKVLDSLHTVQLLVFVLIDCHLLQEESILVRGE